MSGPRTPSPVLNLADVEVHGLDPSQNPKGAPPEGYDIRWGEIARRIGARKLGYNLTVAAPGKRNCAFHNRDYREGE